MSDERTGKVQTVRGLIDADQIGITLMHEHLLIDFRCRFTNPTEASRVAFSRAPFSLERRADIVYDPYGHPDNLLLDDEGEAIEDALDFKLAGGGTIVDMTTRGLGRDPAALRRISAATGLHVSMGAGYYVYLTHPADMDQRSEDQIGEEMVRDIEVGVGDSGIRCGHIGEIGCERQTPNEMKVVRAAARAQRATGAMLNIHQEYMMTGRSAHTIADAVEGAGGDLSRTVISHMDGSDVEPEYQRSLLERGLTLEYDVFGWESYLVSDDMQPPSDGDRVRGIKHLFDSGWGSQVLVSQDVCMKILRTKYGGTGYAHILNRIAPRFRKAGLGDEELHTLLVANPRRLLTFDAPRP